MSNSVDWQAVKYQQVFDDETRGIVRRMESDPDCTADDLEGTLRNLYIMDGANYDGRGPLQDIILAATIAAYERFISQIKTENVSIEKR
ncbi:MAG: hypothetical protein FWC19_04275 [Treponema sp.]|nr:hypothetical protein [Treponema sp.]MCL2272008.1 hypothetical protein [Treponema sp.]